MIVDGFIDAITSLATVAVEILVIMLFVEESSSPCHGSEACSLVVGDEFLAGIPLPVAVIIIAARWRYLQRLKPFSKALISAFDNIKEFRLYFFSYGPSNTISNLPSVDFVDGSDFCGSA